MSEAGTQNGQAAYLTIEDILNARDVREEDVSVPEWGGKVRVRALTVGEQDAIQVEALEHGPGARPGQVDNQKLQTLLFIHSVVTPRFQLAHFPALQQKSSAAMRRVMEVILRLNGLAPDATAAAEARFPAGAEPPVAVPPGAGVGHDGG